MTSEEYHADKTRVSKSGLDLIRKSPRHYWWKHLNPDAKPEPSKKWGDFGHEFHCAITERDRFDREYFCINDEAKVSEIGGANPRATSKYKEWKADLLKENAGKTAISVADFDTLRYMSDSVLANKSANWLLKKGIAEQSFFFTDPTTGAKCKIRPDWLSSVGVCVDLKSCRDASPNGFNRSVMDYRYHVQNAFYIDGLDSAIMDAPREFCFIAVEKEPPYICAVYALDPYYVQLGRMEYEQDLKTYVNCLKTGNWYGYSDKIEYLTAPSWAKPRFL